MKHKWLTIVFVFCFAFPGVTIADNFDYSEIEKIGFAFHRLGQTKPDFSNWVKTEDQYKKLNPDVKPLWLEQEISRLEQGFYNFRPREDAIEFEAKIKISAMPHKDMAGTDERYFLISLDAGDSDLFYFPFLIGEAWIALIPQGMDGFDKIPIGKERYNRLSQELFIGASATTTGILRTTLIPTSVDTNATFNIGGIDMWLMSAKVVDLTISSNEGNTLLWARTASGYHSKIQRELMNLYGK